MTELAIQTHDFNNAKEQLKRFSKEIPSSIYLQSVATSGGLFDLFDHNVTGDELNKLTTQIQEYLISSHDLHNKSIKEFGQVYEALEALDKDYIQAIITAIKAAEEASRQAKESAFEAQKNSIDIIKTIEVQKRTINVLNQFKEKIDGLKYLINIDEIWSNCQTFEKDIKSINSRIKNQEEKICNEISENRNDINNLLGFKEQLNNLEHINEIDDLWSDTQAFKNKIASVNDSILELKDDIKEQIIQNSELCAQLDKDKKNYEDQIKQLFKQLKISYILAGGSIGIALISIALNIFGII